MVGIISAFQVNNGSPNSTTIGDQVCFGINLMMVMFNLLPCNACYV